MTSNSSPINGDPSVLQLDRAIGELRRGRAIRLRGGDGTAVIAAAEMLRQPLLERLRSTGAPLHLVMTAQRAAALGLSYEPDDVAVLSIMEHFDAAQLRQLAGTGSESVEPSAQNTHSADVVNADMSTVLRFVKSGRLLPALVWSIQDVSDDASMIELDVAALDQDAAVLANHRLERVSEAHVPLADALDTRIVMFRDEYMLGEHIAVLVGKPSQGNAVPVRLHSACLTGDLFGSLRCDCGEQLRTAVACISELGGGVLLYLDQEGRGIGLTNKLRAYALQDEGLDTLDADQHLGFLADERSYRVAAMLLRELGFTRVELLTNNPQKIAALRDHGIEVTGRRALIAATTEHNERYLRAKRERAGHLVEDSGN